MQVFDLMIR